MFHPAESCLYGGELVKGFGLLLTQEGIVVIVEVFVIVVLPIAQLRVMVDTVFLLHGLAGDVDHAQCNT
ncbi:hypothetical protein JZ751_008763 [Albula glossodonta]|uniref:Uncharacterized protein n=1 Tax=Albula glossodonta TaxID=121402 RepID=A0A8T2NZV5_9TELE|nr:hypothetical protein JZ751_008763 [Albula glossodonta]